MEQERKDFIKTKIAEIERLIKEFEAKFESGTSDIENFIKIGEIEYLWGELQNGTKNIYTDMIREFMSSIDERELIQEKKDIIYPRE